MGTIAKFSNSTDRSYLYVLDLFFIFRRCSTGSWGILEKSSFWVGQKQLTLRVHKVRLIRFGVHLAKQSEFKMETLSSGKQI